MSEVKETHTSLSATLAWLPQLRQQLEVMDDLQHYDTLERLVVEAHSQEADAGVVGKFIGTYKAWHLKRWRVAARMSPATGKAAKSIAKYVLQLAKGDEDRAVKLWAYALRHLDELPPYVRGKTLLQLNKHIDQIYVHLKSFVVGEPDRVNAYWRSLSALSADKLRELRSQRVEINAKDNVPVDALLISELDAEQVRKNLRWIMRGFEQTTGMRIRTLTELNESAKIIEQQYSALTIAEVGHAFVRAAAGDIKAWNHREGYNIQRILGEVRREKIQGRRR